MRLPPGNAMLSRRSVSGERPWYADRTSYEPILRPISASKPISGSGRSCAQGSCRRSADVLDEGRARRGEAASTRRRRPRLRTERCRRSWTERSRPIHDAVERTSLSRRQSVALERLALVVATGGYGRGTLAPGSESTSSSCCPTSRPPGARASSRRCSMCSGT